MRFSDLLRCEVLDERGERVGHVHDLRLVKDGPAQGAFGPAYRVQGLLVGAGSWGSRLGFDRGEMKGPLPLKVLFRWLRSDARFVDWSVIESLGEGAIRLSVPKERLPGVPPLRQ